MLLEDIAAVMAAHCITACTNRCGEDQAGAVRAVRILPDAARGALWSNGHGRIK